MKEIVTWIVVWLVLGLIAHLVFCLTDPRKRGLKWFTEWRWLMTALYGPFYFIVSLFYCVFIGFLVCLFPWGEEKKEDE